MYKGENKMANNIKTVKGKYIKSNDFHYYFSSGINISIKGQKTFITFFNEIPAVAEQFELNLSEDGFVLSSRDILSESDDTYDTNRIQQCTIEMDVEVAKQIFSFITDNLKGND